MGTTSTVTDGLVVVDKPAGWTSHDVVAKLRGAYGQKKVGHAGTLDPPATGVLLVGLGGATRLLRYLQDAGKAYVGEVVFGTSTTTLDAEGEVVEQAEMTFERADLDAVMPRFLGDIEQIPPMVSAVKIGGRRLHEIARAGEEVERAPRPVRIDRIDVTAFTGGPSPRATLEVECGSGTYIRTLAADLGAALGGHAHLASLRRTRVGSFTLAEAAPLDDVLSDPMPRVLDLATAVRDLTRVDVDDDQARVASHGVPFAACDLLGAELIAGDGRAVEGVGPVALVAPGGRLVAIYEQRTRGLCPAVVIPGPAAVP